ncbi:MAG: LamG-like jellyroll fold domain-containing protein [Planctomycetota bacterium]|jgi:serine/threonine protein kinase
MSRELENIESILYEALKRIDAEERKAYLEATCGVNTQLRADIDSLLQAYENEAGILKAPADLLEEPIITLTEGPGTVIGRYKLLEKIGEGGMAVVYMAEQREPIHRKVALKIIKLGMDTRQVIARFEAERQALAMMDHPNIAKVLDAGATETGRPYFVMELVTGITITEYCDKKKLAMPERLDLFVQVCNAVRHAHQKGIIHRDIKPSNVMVTLYDGKPVPKVIDFGIAKAVNQRLTEKTLFTRYAHMIGTPAYMSPEQAEMSGLDIDRRTDIYSLGVLLYEILTGTTPFDAEEMQRIIREEKPAKPSTKLSTIGEMLPDIAEHRRSSPELLVKLVSGDLDWIVMKALEKNRIRRYETVSALAMDVQMYLENEPVQARPPGAMYRLKRFLHKHRQRVAAAGAMAVILAVMTVFLVMWNQKRIQVKEAEPLRDRSILSKARESYKGDVSSLRTLPEIDPSLVGWWRFDEDYGTTAIDSSGNGHDITLHNITWEDGVFGGAVHFHGVGYGKVGNFRYSNNALTVCAWVWHDELRINKTERYITVAGSAVILKEYDGRLNFYIYTDGNIRSLLVENVLTEGQWHHVAGTWDGLTQHLYIDGVEIASQAPGGVLGNTSNVTISSTQDEPFNGMLDEVRIYNRALTQGEIQFVMQEKDWPFALVPTPADGALHMDTSVNLSWFAGATAISHNMYFGIDEQAVTDADTSDKTGIYRGSQSVTGYIPLDDLEFGRTYYWRIDEVETDDTTIHKGDIWSFRVPPRTAYEPDPPKGVKYVDPNVVLSWTPGFGAMTHTVYFGDSFDDVNNAAGGLFQRTTTYAPGPLELDKVYYWRIDGFDGVTTYKGDVWSFRTLPKISITDPSLVGWWRFDEGYGTTAIDSSGNGHDITLHNITWEDGVFGGAVHFHGVGYGDVENFRYSNNALTVCAWVWHDEFRTGKFEGYVTVGSAVIRKATDGRLDFLDFYIYTDGNIRHLLVRNVLTEGQWHHVAGSWDGLTQCLYFDGVEIAKQSPGGVLGDTSDVMVSSGSEPFNGMLDDVRIYNRALTQGEIQFVMQGKEWPFALVPTPADGALHEDTSVNLSWFAGTTAISHNVYFGTDEQAVSYADTSDTTGIYRGSQSVTGYIPPEDLEFGRTYYWRIDEVEADGTTIHKGDIWSFIVADESLESTMPNEKEMVPEKKH